MSIDGQGTLWRRNIAENFNRLSRAHERYRQTTDGRTMTYSEHELEFTFAKNRPMCRGVIQKITLAQFFLRHFVDTRFCTDRF